MIILSFTDGNKGRRTIVGDYDSVFCALIGLEKQNNIHHIRAYTVDGIELDAKTLAAKQPPELQTKPEYQ